jgi:quinoprotein glucose dehydrogenase
MGGAPPQIPALTGLAGRLNEAAVAKLIREGSGRMPAFAALSSAEVGRIAQYVLSGESKELAPSGGAVQTAYRFTGYKKFLDPEGYPAVAPPWGTLNAINLNTGEYAWKIPLGEYPELARKDTGTENYGGPVVTAGGLVFIGATNFDRKFRAFDKKTGKLLWEDTLPMAGNTTPVTYEAGGRQYVLIYATGGKGKPGSPSGGIFVAYALPTK